jgi:hypothetical protein
LLHRSSTIYFTHYSCCNRLMVILILEDLLDKSVFYIELNLYASVIIGTLINNVIVRTSIFVRPMAGSMQS